MANLEVHHKEFRSHSGEDTAENLITLCSTCHSVIVASPFSCRGFQRAVGLGWLDGLRRLALDRSEARQQYPAFSRLRREEQFRQPEICIAARAILRGRRGGCVRLDSRRGYHRCGFASRCDDRTMTRTEVADDRIKVGGGERLRMPQDRLGDFDDVARKSPRPKTVIYTSGVYSITPGQDPPADESSRRRSAGSWRAKPPRRRS